MAGYIPRWFTCPQTVTHPSINRVQRRLTTLIETNALPLPLYTANPGYMYKQKFFYKCRVLVALSRWVDLGFRNAEIAEEKSGETVF